MKRMLSGIKPTGRVTLGNYIGAIKPFVQFQNEYEMIIFVANLHSMTIYQEPKDLRKNTKDLIALYIADKRGDAVDTDLMEQLNNLPEYVSKLIDDESIFENYAKALKDKHDCYFIGRSLDYASVLEGALKLKEVSYVHADAYIAGELKHGPIALIEPGTVVIAVATQPHVAAKTISNIQETIARSAEVILFTVEGQEVSGVENIYYLPDINPLLQSVLVAIPLQLIAYHTACIKGCDVDKPRNLAKSVTVE